MAIFAEGEVVLVVLADRKRFLMRLQSGEIRHTHRGLIHHDDLIGDLPGRARATHLGCSYIALRPSLDEIIMSIKRISQIVYPKDSGFILMKLNVGSGSRVVECGTGSGALTIALAHAVRPAGRVYSYDRRDDMLCVAAKNLANAGFVEQVELKQRDIEEGFDERDVDALFLDVRTPWLYLSQVWEALTEGGFFGSIVPTANQVSELIAGLNEEPFGDISVCEILLRGYKTVPERLRPTDRMVAHTGYLIFARRLGQTVLEAEEEAEDTESLVQGEAADDDVLDILSADSMMNNKGSRS